MGDYVATQDIPWGGVLAYTRGQRVSAEAVKANDWGDYVVGEGTKEARRLHAEITGQSLAEDDDKAATGRASAKTTEQKG